MALAHVCFIFSTKTLECLLSSLSFIICDISCTAYFNEKSPGGSDGIEYTFNAGDPGLLPGSEGSPGEGKGLPGIHIPGILQYSCLENPLDRGAWWVTVHGDSKSRTRHGHLTHTTHTVIKER